MDDGAPVAISAANDCCKQLAEKLEKSEGGRKKLRQAIALLKEKLDSTMNVMQANESLRQEIERERSRADAEKNNAEAERNARLLLENEGKTLKEQLFSALRRIEKVEVSQQEDKADMQRLKNEVKGAVDSVQTAVKVGEAAQGACRNLERNLGTKVNNACSQLAKASRSIEGNSSKEVQGTILSLKRDFQLLCSRTGVLENKTAYIEHHLENQNRSRLQLQQQQQQHHQQNQQHPQQKYSNAQPQQKCSVAQPQQAAQPQQTCSKAAQRPEATPAARTAHKRPVVQNRKRDIGFEANRSGGQLSGRTTIIPGIESILNPPPVRPPDIAKQPRPPQRDTPSSSLPSSSNGIVEARSADGSDITVQDELARPGHATLLKSINKLFEKEKRNRSKMEAKFRALEATLSQPKVDSRPSRSSKKRSKPDASTEADDGRYKKKARGGNDTRKAKRYPFQLLDDLVRPFNDSGDSDMDEDQLLRHDENRKNLLSPTLPPIPPRIFTAANAPSSLTQLTAAVAPSSATQLTAANAPSSSTQLTAANAPSSSTQPVLAEVAATDEHCQIISAAGDDNVPSNTGSVSDSEKRTSSQPQVEEAQTVQFICSNQELQIAARHSPGATILDNATTSNEICGHASNVPTGSENQSATEDAPAIFAAEDFKACFLDDGGTFKPSEEWTQEYIKKMSLDTLDKRPFLLAMVSCIVDTFSFMEPGSVSQSLHQAAAFLTEVPLPCSRDEVLCTIVKQLSSLLIFCEGYTVTFSAFNESSRPILRRAAGLSETIVASKLVAAVCTGCGKIQLLRSLSCKILRWSRKDNVWILTILASMVSMSEQLFSATNGDILSSAISLAVSGILSEVQPEQQTAFSIASKTEIDDMRLREEPETLPGDSRVLALRSEDVERLQSMTKDLPTFEATIELLVDNMVDLLSTAKDSGIASFDLLKESGLESLNWQCFNESEGSSWHMRFHCAATALELVSFHMGWEWTYNDLIVGKLWSFVAPGANQVSVSSVARLLGLLARSTADESCRELPGVEELRQRLLAVISADQSGFSCSTRVVAAHSLLELSLVDKNGPRLFEEDDELQVIHSKYVVAVQQWYNGLGVDEQDEVPSYLRKRIFCAPVS